MRVLLRTVFLALTLSILSYSAVVTDAQDDIIVDGGGRTCCTYQVDCAENKRCNYIFPYCSQDKNYICE